MWALQTNFHPMNSERWSIWVFTARLLWTVHNWTTPGPLYKIPFLRDPKTIPVWLYLIFLQTHIYFSFQIIRFVRYLLWICIIVNILLVNCWQMPEGKDAPFNSGVDFNDDIKTTLNYMEQPEYARFAKDVLDKRHYLIEMIASTKERKDLCRDRISYWCH